MVHILLMVWIAGAALAGADAGNRYFKEDHLTGADYFRLSSDGTYEITSREHLGVWMSESGRWEKNENALTFTSRKAGRRSYTAHEVSYKGHRFLIFGTEDAPGIVIPEDEVRRRLDAEPKRLPEYVFFEIDKATYQQETSTTYPFRTLKGRGKRRLWPDLVLSFQPAAADSL